MQLSRQPECRRERTPVRLRRAPDAGAAASSVERDRRGQQQAVIAQWPSIVASSSATKSSGTTMPSAIFWYGLRRRIGIWQAP